MFLLRRTDEIENSATLGKMDRGTATKISPLLGSRTFRYI
jgi:hypothetical protein